MNNPYLVQRAKFKNRENRKGLDAILSFDYMGSAEFEFGSLPDSLQRIRAKINQYSYVEYQITKTNTVTIFCKQSDIELARRHVDGLAKNEYRLKEYCDFQYWIARGRESWMSCKNDFWWDISNDWMFWKSDTLFSTAFKTAIKSK